MTPLRRSVVGLLVALVLVLTGCSTLDGEVPTTPFTPTSAAPESTTASATPEPTTATAPIAVPTDERASTVRAVDGDTLVALLEPDGAEIRIRPFAIDAPERGDCGYREARAYVDSQLPVGTAVVLVREAGQRDRDVYGRLLRYVRYAPPDGGPVRDLSLAVVAAGWAEHYDRYPVIASPAIKAAEELARNEKFGQWAPVSAGGCAPG